MIIKFSLKSSFTLRRTQDTLDDHINKVAAIVTTKIEASDGRLKTETQYITQEIRFLVRRLLADGATTRVLHQPPPQQ